MTLKQISMTKHFVKSRCIRLIERINIFINVYSFNETAEMTFWKFNFWGLSQAWKYQFFLFHDRKTNFHDQTCFYVLVYMIQ